MTNKLQQFSHPDSLAERLRQALEARGSSNANGATTGGERCLLLDVSGSMSEFCEPGRSKIAALREIAAQFHSVRKIAFANGVHEVHTIPNAGGNTMLATALRHVAGCGIKHAVLVTDGMPTEPESMCLDAARGLKLDIFYVGPAPAPPFLADLAKATGGQYQAASVARKRQPALVAEIKTRLALKAGEI